jgi:predicted nuclease of predicted toxin-antitoxin system
VKILADMHISPDTVFFLRELGHDAIRVADVLPATAADEAVIEFAIRSGRTVLTQDLDFSALIGLSGVSAPSVITLRLVSSRVPRVNAILEKSLTTIEHDVHGGALITITDGGIRHRSLPLS